MKLRFFYTVLAVLFAINTNAQATNEDVLFKIDNTPVYASEFLRVYNKNLELVQDESQKDVDAYLKLFVNYKLKLKEARDLEYNKKPSYIRELANYKKQLAKNYLTDNKVTDDLVSEAYDRTLNELKASHILIKIPEDASPEDTLTAYNQIMKLRESVINVGFEAVKKDVHNGKTIFAEGLGYFSCFKMVYDFENMAYNTEVGKVSMPFRTKFGYHIVKIFDKRKSRGTVTVAHIMVSNKQTDSLQDAPEIRINDIYKKLLQGEDFESLAKQFSEDKSSSDKGGKLNSFSGGQLSSSEFEDVAFNLKNVGDVSQPFQSNFGWHIVKLYNKEPVKSFAELRPELEVKVKRDSRSQLINNALINTLKERYEVSSEQDALPYFESILSDDYFKRSWELPSDFKGTELLLKIGDSQLTYTDFGEYLVRNQRRVTAKKPFKNLVSESYQTFFNNSLIQYREDNLENEDKDFSYIVDEYRDGLLLFDLMETKIWNAAKTDSVGIQDFYNKNKDNYYWNERIDAVVASSADETVIKNVSELLKNGKAPEDIKKTVNLDNKVNVIFTSGVMDANHQALPKDFVFQKGISKVHKHNDAFVVIQGKDLLPKKLKTFDEAKGKIISDYQIYKENKWLEDLSNKYQVVVNQDVLTKVKSQI